MAWGGERLGTIATVGIVLVIAAGTGATDAVGSGEGPVWVESSDGLPWFGFGLSPKLLSRTEPAPARLTLGFAFERGGSLPPALSPVSVELDKHVALEATGIPGCRGFGVQGGVEPARDCRESIVGRGNVTSAIRFPEQEPKRVSSPVVVYYGGRRDGITRLHALGYLDLSTPSALDIEIDLKPISDGRFGTEASFSMPRIAAGRDSIAVLELSLFKRFSYRGRRRSFVSATCSDGRLEAIASAFRSPPSEGETPLEEPSVRACTPGR